MAVPTWTARAPQQRNSRASSPVMMPPMPTTGMRTARASSWTMRSATGLMAGPERPPLPVARRGRRASRSIAVARRVLMAVSASAPSASAARPTPVMSPTLGESFTQRGARTRARTARTIAARVCGSVARMLPHSGRFGLEAFSSRATTPGAPSSRAAHSANSSGLSPQKLATTRAPAAQPQLHHDRVLAGAVVAAADAQVPEAELAVEPPRDHVPGAHLEVDDARARRLGLRHHRPDQHPPVPQAAPLGMDRDVQQVDLVGHPPPAGVADHLRPGDGLLHRHHQARERGRQLLLEEGARPGLRERAPLDVEHGGQVLAPHVAQERARQLGSDGHVHHRMSAAPQVKPAPKAARQTRAPGLTRPCWTASWSAIGIEAAVVLP